MKHKAKSIKDIINKANGHAVIAPYNIISSQLILKGIPENGPRTGRPLPPLGPKLVTQNSSHKENGPPTK